MKTEKLFYLPLSCFFFFSQIFFLNHQLNHSEKTNHPEFCFVCQIDTPVSWSLSQDIIHWPAVEKNPLFKKPPFIFVKKNLYSQSLPRSPPLKQTFNSVFI